MDVNYGHDNSICSDNHLWEGKVFQGSVSQHTHPVGRATHLPLSMLTPCDGEMPNVAG